MLSRRNDLRHEPDARMVEIEVYSTVGTSWNVYDIMRNVGGKVRQRCGGSLRQRLKNGVKDVVKMVAFCAKGVFTPTILRG